MQMYRRQSQQLRIRHSLLALSSSSQNDTEDGIRITQALLGKTPPLQDLSLLWQPHNTGLSKQRLSKSVKDQQERETQKQSTCVQYAGQPFTP
jgi:hypothetical protein